MEITKVYPLDAVFDNPEDVPEDVKIPYIVSSVLFQISIIFVFAVFCR